MNELEIKIKKLDERAVIPTYSHVGDVGMDMTAIDVEYDEEKDMYIYHTGLAFESPFNIGQFLFLRSSNSKKECYLCNHVGIADSAIYRGEIQFRMKNRDSIDTIATNEAISQTLNEMSLSNYKECNLKNFSEIFLNKKNEIYNKAKKLEYAPYKVGDRIGQMVFLEYPTVNLIEVDSLSDTERGCGGFGSSGN